MESVNSSASSDLLTSINIHTLKKATELAEANIGKLLESASIDGVPTLDTTPKVSQEAQALVSDTTQRGGNLDMSA